VTVVALLAALVLDQHPAIRTGVASERENIDYNL